MAERADVEVADEDNSGFGCVELPGFVSPDLASILIERRIEAAGDELFVDAWGANLLGGSRGRRGRRPHNDVAAYCGAGASPALLALKCPMIT